MALGTKIALGEGACLVEKKAAAPPTACGSHLRGSLSICVKGSRGGVSCLDLDGPFVSSLTPVHCRSEKSWLGAQPAREAVAPHM